MEGLGRDIPEIFNFFLHLSVLLDSFLFRVFGVLIVQNSQSLKGVHI